MSQWNWSSIEASCKRWCRGSKQQWRAPGALAAGAHMRCNIARLTSLVPLANLLLDGSCRPSSAAAPPHPQTRLQPQAQPQQPWQRPPAAAAPPPTAQPRPQPPVPTAQPRPQPQRQAALAPAPAPAPSRQVLTSQHPLGKTVHHEADTSLLTFRKDEADENIIIK